MRGLEDIYTYTYIYMHIQAAIMWQKLTFSASWYVREYTYIQYTYIHTHLQVAVVVNDVAKVNIDSKLVRERPRTYIFTHTYIYPYTYINTYIHIHIHTYI